MPSLLKRFEGFLNASHDVRRLGSAALDLCWLAAGRADGYWEDALNPWDVSAGILILQEAGGKVTGFDGKKILNASRITEKRFLQATAKDTRGKCLKIIRRTEPEKPLILNRFYVGHKRNGFSYKTVPFFLAGLI